MLLLHQLRRRYVRRFISKYARNKPASPLLSRYTVLRIYKCDPCIIILVHVVGLLLPNTHIAVERSADTVFVVVNVVDNLSHKAVLDSQQNSKDDLSLYPDL